MDSVVSYQERSIGIIAEMRKLATENSKEIRDAVEDGKKRMAHLIEQGAAVALIAKTVVSDTTVPVKARATAPALPEEPRKLDDVHARHGRGRHAAPSRAASSTRS